MAKEKKFRSGKKKRKKKAVLLDNLDDDSLYNQWETSKKKAAPKKRKRKVGSLKETQNKKTKKPGKKKKKKKEISLSEWIAWNRAQTSGLSIEELSQSIEVTTVGDTLIYEVSLQSDAVKIATAKKQKHTKNLSNLLSRIP